MPKPNTTGILPWHYRYGEPITEIFQFPEDAHGFVYRITNTRTGKWYVGKKNLYSTRNIKLGKKALAAREDKRASKRKVVVTESDWKTYYGSEPGLLKDIQTDGHGAFRRDILCICFTKAELTYEELRQQIILGCLESDNCYNGNLLGKFFRPVKFQTLNV